MSRHYSRRRVNSAPLGRHCGTLAQASALFPEADERVCSEIPRMRGLRAKPTLGMMSSRALQPDLTLPVLAARAAAVVMVGIAAFQVALVFGAPWGAYTQGGGTEGALDTSGRVLAAVSCAILLAMAAAILARVHELPSRTLRRDSRPPSRGSRRSIPPSRLSSTWLHRARRSAPFSRRPRPSFLRSL